MVDQTPQSGNSAFVIFVQLVLLSLFCGGVGSCKKWQYDECRAVGHGASYCAADVAGCFNGGKK